MGWAWYIDEKTWSSGGLRHGTNNQGELLAVIHLLDSFACKMRDQHLHILCDSLYTVNSITKWMPGWQAKGWKKADGKPVLNRDLLQQLSTHLADMQGRVSFEWVRGHTGHYLNEKADALAREAALAQQAALVR